MFLIRTLFSSMPKSQSKYYAVRIGRSTGVFHSWEECQRQTSGFAGASFKSFSTMEEANEFAFGTMKKATPYTRDVEKKQPIVDTPVEEELDPTPIKLTLPKTKPTATKFYAVVHGHKTGIFDSWESCRQQVTNFSNPKFKSFKTRAEAEEFMHQAELPKPANDDDSSQSSEFRYIPAKAQTSSESSSEQEPSFPSHHFSFSGGRPTKYEDNERIPTSLIKTEENMHISSSDESSTFTSDKIEKPKKSTKKLSHNSPLVIYTDGSCKGQGPSNTQRRGGVGVYFGPNDPRNVSEKLVGDQTNNRAELTAIIRALQIAPKDRPLEIRSDSEYSIKAVTQWINAWKKTQLDQVKNIDLILHVHSLLKSRDSQAKVKLTHVRGHQGEEGNEAADKLAVEGAERP